MQEDGIDVEQLERRIEENEEAGFIYLVPEFQNPTGITLSMRKRESVVKIADKYGLLIVEDSPYRDIRYIGEHLPSIYSLYPQGTILLKTLSKVAAPGFRVGWAVASEEIIKAFRIVKSASVMFSPSVNEAALCSYLKGKRQEGALVSKDTLKDYHDRRDAIIKALADNMPSEVKWTEPQGGFVLWVTLPQGVDSEQLLKIHAAPREVSFIPGKFFYPGGKGPHNTLRLSFGVIDPSLIKEGVTRLSEAIRQYQDRI